MSGTARKGRKPAAERKKSAKAYLPKFDPFKTTQAASGLRVGFPAHRTVNLAYVAETSFGNTSGVINKIQFRLNSAFDPDYTFTGHQPMGFDQWSLFYNHYVVEKCEYEVMIATPNATPMYFGCHVSDDATIPSTIQNLVELGSSIQSDTIYKSRPIFKGTVDMAKFFNRTGDIANDEQLRALTTANPAEEVYLSVWGQPADAATTLTTFFIVRLNMRVRFMEPKDLAPSSAGAVPLRPKGSTKDDEYEFVRVKKVL